jgi:hypothetical protein
MIVQTTHLRCDAPGCSTIFSVRHIHDDDMLRQWAQENGWQRRLDDGGLFSVDFCPQHKRHPIVVTKVERT